MGQKETFENNPVVVVLSLMLAAYLAGIGTVKTIEEISGSERITRATLEHYQKLEGEKQAHQKDLDSVRASLLKYQQLEQARQAEVEKIIKTGGIYRVPNEPMVWLVRGGSDMVFEVRTTSFLLPDNIYLRPLLRKRFSAFQLSLDPIH